MYAFNTFFLPELRNPVFGFNSVAKWVDKVSHLLFEHSLLFLCQLSVYLFANMTDCLLFQTVLLGCEVLLVPVHQPGHWSLITVNVKLKTVGYCDSMGGEFDDGVDSVIDYLKRKTDVEEWTRVLVEVSLVSVHYIYTVKSYKL